MGVAAAVAAVAATTLFHITTSITTTITTTAPCEAPPETVDLPLALGGDSQLLLHCTLGRSAIESLRWYHRAVGGKHRRTILYSTRTINAPPANLNLEFVGDLAEGDGSIRLGWVNSSSTGIYECEVRGQTARCLYRYRVQLVDGARTTQATHPPTHSAPPTTAAVPAEASLWALLVGGGVSLLLLILLLMALGSWRCLQLEQKRHAVRSLAIRETNQRLSSPYDSMDEYENLSRNVGQEEGGEGEVEGLAEREGSPRPTHGPSLDPGPCLRGGPNVEPGPGWRAQRAGGLLGLRQGTGDVNGGDCQMPEVYEN